MKLIHFPLNTGSHMAGWRWPGAWDGTLHDLAFYQTIARAAERGKFDAIFFADTLGFYPVRGPNAFAQGDLPRVEPLSLLAALAATTERLGLAATASTTYGAPFHIARQFASIDHLSAGRAAWNIVTSALDDEARNFGEEHIPDHDARYDRARECVAVVRSLWDSFEDEALIADKASGRYTDPARIHASDHQGAHFRVAGPLNVARPPQGHPVLFQAGGSPAGMRFAAETADVVFTSNSTMEGAKAFHDTIKAMVREAGRDPDAVKVITAFHQIVAPSIAQAQSILDGLNDLLPEALAFSILETNLGGIDLSPYDPDGPLPDMALTEKVQGTQTRLIRWSTEEHLSIRQIARRMAAQRTGTMTVGTGPMVADEMERWFRAGACDGFMVTAPYLPGGLEAFVDQVVPVLQARGLFRTEYTGRTLRDHLGLPRPRNGFVAHPDRHAEPRCW